jgi:maleamate amidohydrolase
MSEELSGTWRDMVPPGEALEFGRAEFGRMVELGKAPAVLVVDMTKMMFAPESPLAPTGGGAGVFKACASLVDFGRRHEWPVVWTKRADRRLAAQRGVIDLKWSSRGLGPDADDFVEPLAPLDDEIVIGKPRQSAFFETSLRSQLSWLGIDTVVVCGMSTSGCVRASVVDAFSSNFRVLVVEEAVGDRSPFSHAASLFDMNMKNASVIPFSTLEKQVGSA